MTFTSQPRTQRSEFQNGTVSRPGAPESPRWVWQLSQSPPSIGPSIESRTPGFLAGRKQTHRQLDQILGSSQEPLRAVFVLYELENRELSEIAALLRIPRGAVASRLRRARTRLREHPDAIELVWDNGVEGVASIEGPPRLRRGELTKLERALLTA